MKRFFICYLFMMCVVNLNAQHISFLGIQLGQSESNVDRLLRQKGFTLEKKVNGYFYARRYKGDFWKFEDVAVNTIVDNGLVTGISACPSPFKYNSISYYNDVVKNLDRKYGRHFPISSFFKYSEYADKKGYYWRVKGGYIVTDYVYSSDGEMVLIDIVYLDNTNRDIILEHGKKRRTDDDL